MGKQTNNIHKAKNPMEGFFFFFSSTIIFFQPPFMVPIQSPTELVPKKLGSEIMVVTGASWKIPIIIIFSNIFLLLCCGAARVQNWYQKNWNLKFLWLLLLLVYNHWGITVATAPGPFEEEVEEEERCLSSSLSCKGSSVSFLTLFTFLDPRDRCLNP